MSNTLSITVGNFSRLDLPGVTSVIVIACDSYGNDVLTFDDEDHLLTCYPTKEDLIVSILRLPSFECAAIFNQDGTYELDYVSGVSVQGFPER